VFKVKVKPFRLQGAGTKITAGTVETRAPTRTTPLAAQRPIRQPSIQDRPIQQPDVRPAVRRRWSCPGASRNSLQLPGSFQAASRQLPGSFLHLPRPSTARRLHAALTLVAASRQLPGIFQAASGQLPGSFQAAWTYGSCLEAAWKLPGSRHSRRLELRGTAGARLTGECGGGPPHGDVDGG
jgi:hypothetical protein